MMAMNMIKVRLEKIEHETGMSPVSTFSNLTPLFCYLKPFSHFYLDHIIWLKHKQGIHKYLKYLHKSIVPILHNNLLNVRS